MKYRIVEETDKAGKKLYYIEKKAFLFWFYMRIVLDMSMYRYRICFESFSDAESHIKEDIANTRKRKLQKVISRIKVPIIDNN